MKIDLKMGLVIILLVIALQLPLVLGIGIRPAKTNLMFEDAEKYSSMFWVVNNDKREFSVKVYAEGDLADYIKIKQKEITFTSSEELKAVDFELNFPKKIPLGAYNINIIIEELLNDPNPEVISSKLVIKHKIIIEGPRPDKFVVVKLNFQNIGDKVELVSEIENQGLKDLGEVQTKFLVNNVDADGKELPFLTEATTLKINETKLLKAYLEKKSLTDGEFDVMAVTTYDDLEIETTRKLRIGEPKIDIAYFDKYFIANKINSYSMDLLNKWNKEIENVFVEVEVKKDENKIDEFRTKSVNIGGFAIKRIEDYFDAKNKNTGKYSFEMVVNFWNNYRMEKKIFQSELLTEKEFANLKDKNLIGNATGGNVSGTLIGVLIGVLALMGLMGSYVFYRYKHREEYEDGDEDVF